MSYRTHKAEVSLDGKTLTFWDLTPEQEYIDNGAGLSDVVQFVVSVANDMNGEFGEADITTEWLDSREITGVTIDAATFGLYSFDDDIYMITSTATFDPGLALPDEEAISEEAIYPNVKNKVMQEALKTDWKDTFGPSYVYFRNSFRTQALMRNLEYANELGLMVEAKRLLIALLKLTGLWTGMI